MAPYLYTFEDNGLQTNTACTIIQPLMVSCLKVFQQESYSCHW